MDRISITTTADHLSIKKGFTWSDIPMFAIITGVNGAGKTHLIKILESGTEDYKKNLGTKPKVQPKIYNAIDSNGNKTELIMSKTKAKFDIAALVDYNLNRYKVYKQIENELKSLRGKEGEDSNISISQLPEMHRRLEKALMIISEDSGILIDDLTEANIRDQFSLSFNHLSKIDNLNSYIAQEEKNRNEKYIKFAKESRESEIKGIRDAEKAYEKINRLFRKFGFDTYLIQDPYPADKSRAGTVEFIGKNRERVKYDALSSGEQMIVEFIIWEMGKDVRGNSINIMLLDEYDAHLHPSMCKMMIEILSDITKPKEEGGSGIRVIMTTHSPSTVAFAPEGSLFVMEKDEDGNRSIRSTSNSEAMSVLSDGIFTFDKVIDKFTLAANTTKNNLLFVEGKTDINHIEKAMSILGYGSDLEIIDMHDAGALANFIKSTPASLFLGKKIIALFDCDDEGRKAYKSITGDLDKIANAKILTATQCAGSSFALLIQAPTLVEKYCPIEFLYPQTYLQANNVFEKRNEHDFLNLYKAEGIKEIAQLIEEYKNETSLRPFKVKDNIKNRFSENIKQETDKAIFENFKSTLEVIKKIIKTNNNG